MRKLALAVVVVAGVLGARSALSDEKPATIPLWQAYRDGKVTVKGRSLGGYSRAALSIKNATRESVTVDVNASYLEPVGGSVQRLGMGLLKPGSSTTEVEVRAGATVDVEVLSVCMDGSRSSPCEASRFILAKEEAPPAAAKTLRVWKAHPELDQCAVQSKVWGHDPAPRRKGEPTVIELPELTRKVGVAGGTVFAIVGPGELYAGKPRGELLPIAQDAHDLIVQEDGLHVLFRTPPAAVSSGTRERRMVIAHHESDGSWREELTVKTLGRLELVTNGAALVAEEKDLVLLRGSPGTTNVARQVVGAATDPVVRSAGKAVIFSAKGDGTRLVEVALRGGMVEPRAFAASIPVSQVALDAGGQLLALSPRGILYSLGPDGEARRLHHLVDDGTWAKTGGKEELIASLCRGEGGVLLHSNRGWSLYKEGTVRRDVPGPLEGADLLLSAEGALYGLQSTTLTACAEGRWEKVTFIIPAPLEESPLSATAAPVVSSAR